MTGSAKQSRATTRMDCFVASLLATTANTTPRSRGAMRPSGASTFRPAEGVGNAGCPPHPQPRVRNNKAHERSHHRYSRIHPAFPHAMVLTAYFVLSPVTGLSCHRRRADRSAKLDTSVGASGPHDFAVRDPSTPKASTGLVPVRRSFSEGGNSAIRPRAMSAPDAAASIASRPASVTIAIRPLFGAGRRRYRFDLGQAGTEIFLQTGLDC
jgi:hypothetical protein